MDRHDFHPWGEALDDLHFTRAIAMAAALEQAATVPKNDPRRHQYEFIRRFEHAVDEGDEDLGAHTVDESDADWVWHLVERGLRIDPASLSAWIRARSPDSAILASLWVARAPVGVAFQLVGSLTHAQAVEWIAALATLGERCTVVREAPVADPAPVWGVPARVAVHGRDASAARWRAVVAAVAHTQPDLVVDVSDQHGERDIVLITGSLRAGLAAVLAGDRGPRAQLACVLGGADVPPVAAGPMLDVLRHELSAIGVVVTAVEPDEGETWLGALLADEEWWVEAVWSHTRATDRPHPFIAVDPAIHGAMSPWVLMREAAARAALRLEREGLDRMSARLAGRYTRAWLREVIAVNRPNSEMGGPSEEGPRERLIGLQTALGGLGRPMRPGSWVEDLPAEPRYARFVVTRTNGDAWRPVERFIAGEQHRVEVWIAAGEGGTPAEDPFPEPEQPDADGAVDLSVVLCLIDPRDGAAPASAVIRLPARGDSERAVFSLRPPAVPFVARVVVSHRQRVLQTLLLTQPTDGPPRLAVELRVHESLGPSLAGREPFDAAIVLNPSTALAIGAGGAGLALLPVGSDAAIRGIQEILEREDIRGVELRGRDRASARALHQLALHGHELWDAVVNRPGMAEHLAHARRIQVVEAREGAYLPVELFYGRPAPVRPRLCASAGKSLHAGACADPACRADPEQYVCPYAFWGLSRVLERMPHPGRPLADGADLALVPAPEGGRDALAPFERGVFAASSVVKAPERKRISRALSSVVRGSLRTVKGWHGVAEVVHREQPSLLTLVTHTVEDGDKQPYDVLQLELSGRPLAAANLTAVHIREPEAARPLVLLVGCDTRAPLAGYRGFAGRFLRHGAAIVVCTIAAISPADAVDFLEQFAETLRDTAEHEAVAFGELMLAVRQRLFGVRWPMALGVVSCGDALWYLDR